MFYFLNVKRILFEFPLTPSYVCRFWWSWSVSHFPESWSGVASLLYPLFIAADKWSPGSLTFDNSYKRIQATINEQMMHLLKEQNLNPICVYDHCCWLRAPFISQSSRIIKAIIFVLLCSSVAFFTPCVFLHRFVDFFNVTCGVKIVWCESEQL